MQAGEVRRVANPPSKPLMLFDGDCHFCRRWIERWRETTGDKIEYLPAQEAGGNYAEIEPAEFAQAVQFIDTDGRIYRGAEAVFRSLGKKPGGSWLAWAYDRVPGFAGVAKAGYSIIARNRSLASAGTRLIWGKDVRRPTYFVARRGFLNGLGLVYLIAFISAWVQIDGLMGERGVVPTSDYLNLIGRSIGDAGTPAFLHPTLSWIDSSSRMLHALCAFGVVVSALLTFGVVPIPALLGAFVAYLSLVNAGQLFFSYQWDILLLETGFIALFVAPWQWRLRRGADRPVPVIGRLLVLLLLFKLMFMSGVVKLTSGDETWIRLTALDYHYWTQPLPTVFAWFADKSPMAFKKFSVAATLFVEIVVPFFIFGPRRVRLVAAALLIALQIAIAVTGNYNFFNLLTILLCLFLIDDASWAPKRARESSASARGWAKLGPAVALIITLPVNMWITYTACAPEAEIPAVLRKWSRQLQTFHLVSGYGLFRVMTKDRPEIVFEGSADAFDWHPYEFRWKPGDLQRPPQWNAPHQPRLDWSMWFAALGSRRDAVVGEGLAKRMLEGEPAVLALLVKNPFPASPPQFVRASLYHYKFTTLDERRQTGAWWKRELRRQFLPTVSLNDFHR